MKSMMTMNGALLPREDLDRLYMTRKEGGRGWMSVEDVVKVKEHSMSDYLKRAKINSDRVLDFLEKKMKQELITQQKKMKLASQATTWAVSVMN